MIPTVEQLKKAIAIREQITQLERELSEIFNASSVEERLPNGAPIKRTPTLLKPGRKPMRARDLGDSMLDVLRASSSPMRSAEIYAELERKGYPFTSVDAKKLVGVRLCSLKGAKKVGLGLYTAQ